MGGVWREVAVEAGPGVWAWGWVAGRAAPAAPECGALLQTVGCAQLPSGCHPPAPIWSPFPAVCSPPFPPAPSGLRGLGGPRKALGLQPLE